MALTTIAGTILVPSGAAPDSARLLFTLASWDEGGEVVYAPDPIEEVLVGNAYSLALESTTDKVRQSVYKVELSWYSRAKRATLVEALGVIAVTPSGGPFSLPDLLAAPITEPVPADILALALAAAESALVNSAIATAAAESMTAVMDFVTVAAEPIWSSSRMKFVTDTGQWLAKRVNLMVVGGQSNRVRYSLSPGAGESQGNVFVWNGSTWVVATPAMVGDITYVEAHRVSVAEARPVFIVHGAVAGTTIARWVPGGDLFDALKASAIAAMADLSSRGYQISRKVYDFSQGEGEYNLAPLFSLSTSRYPALINGVRGADYLGSGCQIIVTELLRQSSLGTTDRVNREWRRLISDGYTGVHLVSSDGMATEDPTDGSVQVVHFDPASRIEMGIRCADVQLGLSNGVTSGDVAGRITATGERIWKERAYTWLGVFNASPGNINPYDLNLLTAITGTPILWEVGGVTAEIASGSTASVYTYTGSSSTQVVVWGPTDANYDQAMGFSAVATPGQGGIRSFVLNPLAHLKSVYISGHSGLMHNVAPSTWGLRMETFRLDAAPLVRFDDFLAADMPKSMINLTFTSTTPVPQSVIDDITAENAKRGGAISVTIGGTPAGFRKGNHFSTFSQLTTAIAAGYRESNGQIISIGDAGAQTLYWLIADTAAAGVGGIAPAGWKVATTGDAARIAALEALGGTGLIIRAPVALATTGNITLSGEQMVDGSMTAGTAVAVKDQTLPAQNGVYISAAGAWTRRADMDSAAEVKGTAVYVSGGTINAGRRYYTGSTVTTIGTDPITWVLESDSAFILAQLASINAAVSAEAITRAAADTALDGDITLLETLTGKDLINRPVAAMFVGNSDKPVLGVDSKGQVVAATPTGLVPMRNADAGNLWQNDGVPKYYYSAGLRLPKDIARRAMIIPGYGQSLAGAANDNPTDTLTNATATYSTEAFMPSVGPSPDGAFFDRLRPLVDIAGAGINTRRAHWLSPMANGIIAAMDSAFAVRPKIITFSASEGGRTYKDLMPGNPAFDYLARGIQCSCVAARKLGLLPWVPAIFWVQGEQNRVEGLTEERIRRDLQAMAREVTALVRGMTGQPDDPIIFISQPNNSTADNGVIAPHMSAPVSLDGVENFRVLPPHYNLGMSADGTANTGVHPDSAGYQVMGQRFADVFMEEIFGRGYTAIKCIRAFWEDSSTIRLHYQTRGGDLTIDTSGAVVVVPTWSGSLNGWQFYDGSVSPPTVSSMTVVDDPDTAGTQLTVLRIVLSAPSTGPAPRLHYATRNDGTGANSGRLTGPRGCIRDSVKTTFWANSQIIHLGRP